MKNFTQSKKFYILLFTTIALALLGVFLFILGETNLAIRDIWVGLGAGFITSAIVSFLFSIIENINTNANCKIFEANIENVATRTSWFVFQALNVRQIIYGNKIASGSTVFYIKSDSVSVIQRKIVSFFFELAENAITRMLASFEKCKYVMRKPYAEACKHFMGCIRRLKTYKTENENLEKWLKEFYCATCEILAYSGLPKNLFELSEGRAADYVKFVTEKKPKLALCLEEKDFIVFDAGSDKPYIGLE